MCRKCLLGVVGNRSKAKFGVNFSINPKTYFDGYDWSQRKSGQPFFAQVHIKQPHRKFSSSNQDHPDASIPPYYPDHPLTRADWDAYLDSIELLDKKVGAILTRLEDEGLIDNTLIFFFGDHGRPHVRCKQWLYDGGIRTPMIVSWPKHVKPGTKEEALVSLLDVMPTTLKAAGISKIQLPGKDLLASDWQGHDVIFSARDRCGDAPDRIRSLRTSNLKYIKNFHPELPYLQLSSYKKLGYPVQTLMKVLHAEGRWDSPFMNSRRPEEELYDLTKDPFELNNVADQPEYRAKLIECRQRLERWILTTGDDGDKDESKTVDLEKVMVEKREWYEKTMRERGLDPEISDSDYLQWWFKEMRLESNN
ncbi:MAG: sulfatase-like hydrolase/transferase [Planctomycetota bacterium]